MILGQMQVFLGEKSVALIAGSFNDTPCLVMRKMEDELLRDMDSLTQEEKIQLLGTSPLILMFTREEGIDVLIDVLNDVRKRFTTNHE